MAQRCDILLRGGWVVDGTGAPSRKADVAVTSDLITAVDADLDWQATETIDVAGQVVAPGFIDTHSHDDLALLIDPDQASRVSQGVTTVIAGNCGISAAPLPPDGPLPDPFPLLGDISTRFERMANFRDAIAANPPAVNVALLTGHTALRVAAMGDDLGRPARPAEIELMQALLAESLQSGSIGLSSGLDYPPANASSADEIAELTRVVGRFPGAVYATHMRDEGAGSIESIHEAVAAAAAGGCTLVISHHKLAGVANYGRSRETVALIEAAGESASVYMDVYPYTASSTVLLPRFIEGAERVLVASSVPHPEMADRDLADIAAEWSVPATEAAEKLAPATAIYFQMSEEDVTRIIASSRAMIGSDGIPAMTKPHPRLWGTFARVLGSYVRDRGVLTLESAIHRMTGMPASVFALKGRGRIAVGHVADLTCFDLDEVRDRATFEAPTTPALGFSHVFVGGRCVWRSGSTTSEHSGRFLARAA